MILLLSVNVADAGNTVKFDTAAPVLDVVRRLEGRLGEPINIDLGPTHHRLRLEMLPTPAPFLVDFPSDAGGLESSLNQLASQISTHPSWDGCLKLKVLDRPLTLQATRVAIVDAKGKVIGCQPYHSPLDIRVAGWSNGEPRDFDEICQDAGIYTDDHLDPLTESSKRKGTIREMLTSSGGDWSYVLMESVVSARRWTLKVGRPGEGVRDLDPADYAFHPDHQMERFRQELDQANPVRNHDSLIEQRAAYEAALDEWRSASPAQRSSESTTPKVGGR